MMVIVAIFIGIAIGTAIGSIVSINLKLSEIIELLKEIKENV